MAKTKRRTAKPVVIGIIWKRAGKSNVRTTSMMRKGRYSKFAKRAK